MIRTIIMVVFVMPLIQLILRKLQENSERERYTGTIYVPSSYLQVLLWCMVIAAACGAVLCLRFGFEEVKGVLVLIAGLIVITELFRLSFRRYKVVVGEEGLEITPFLGFRRKVSFDEIDSIKENSIGDLKIIVRGKKVGLVDRAAVGYKEFRRLMEKKGLLGEKRSQ